MISTSMNPITMVLTSSLNELRALMLWSPVMTTSRLGGKYVAFKSLTILSTPSAVSIRFSPARFTTLRVITFLPFKRA